MDEYGEAGSGISTEFFSSREYESKEDIVQAVIEYNSQLSRPFRVVSSDKRRYKAVCTHDHCTFVANFAFSSSFGRPTKFVEHSCQLSDVHESTRPLDRKGTAKQIALNPSVRDMMATSGRDVTPIAIKKKLTSMKINSSYQNCVNALIRLKREFFCDDLAQYAMLPSYLEALQLRGHKTIMDVDHGVFKRLCIVYREGIVSYKHFSSRGIVIDGTSIKTSVRGVLLVTCFRHGNNQIQIVAIGIVSIENEDNWTWYLKQLHAHLSPSPSFIISDRDKGLTQAAKSIFVHTPHFFCFRHLMENFNKKFKSKELKNAAWAIARSKSDSDYETKSNALAKLNQGALNWLLEVGVQKWSLLFSPCPRFDTRTSNNVESINSALKTIRALPVIDCLMEIERYVAIKRYEISENLQKWGEFTHYLSRRIDNLLTSANCCGIVATSTSNFIIRTKPDRETNSSTMRCGYLAASISAAHAGAPKIKSLHVYMRFWPCSTTTGCMKHRSTITRRGRRRHSGVRTLVTTTKQYLRSS